MYRKRSFATGGRSHKTKAIPLSQCNPFLTSEKLRPLAGHGADPFPPVDIAQVELYRLNRPFDQPTRIVVAEHG